jgi:hypothetical protein
VTAADRDGGEVPALAGFSEAQHQRAMSRFAVLRPHLDEGARLAQVAADSGRKGHAQGFTPGQALPPHATGSVPKVCPNAPEQAPTIHAQTTLTPYLTCTNAESTAPAIMN